MNAGGWSVDLTRETGWLLARTSELGQNIFKTNKQKIILQASSSPTESQSAF